MKSKTTLKELSEILNLSISTVSKALNDSSEIGKSTKKTVVETAKMYNYTPNFIAQSLKTRLTKNIGVIIPNVMDEFFTKVLCGIEKYAKKKNYELILSMSHDSIRNEDQAISSFIAGRVDGLLMSLSKEAQTKNFFSHIQRVIDCQLPLVMFDRICDDISCDKIIIDDFTAAYEATRSLFSKGCKKIAFLSTISDTSVGNQRMQGYATAVMKIKGNGAKPYVIDIDSYENFEALFNLFIANNGDDFDGILAADQLSAVNTMNILKHKGYNIPQEIMIIGFTDGLMAKFHQPSLSVVRQNAEKMGEVAAKALINRIEKTTNRRPIRKTIKTELIERGSTSNSKNYNLMAQ